MPIGFIQPALEVMEGGVQASEIPPYIQFCISMIMVAVIMTTIMATATSVWESGIEYG